jgi:organic hydroperoxide reductase OsmC/OhrA
MEKQHHFKTTVIWTGNRGQGTIDAKAYDRHNTLKIKDKQDILCSSDPAFSGDGTKHNPEDLFVAALSQCHMLWYLHIAADNGVVVTNYEDNAEGTMLQLSTGGGHFTEVTLNPIVTITDASKIELANSLHKKAAEKCFIGNSCNFQVKHLPKAVVG